MSLKSWAGWRLPGAVIVLVLLPAAVGAQALNVLGSPDRPLGIQGFVELAPGTFTAKDSFEAVLGTSTGTFVGGGGRLALTRGPLRGLLFEVSLSRFRGTGERVFVFDGDVFPLGIPTTVTITPLLATVGYRFGPMGRLAPYAGGGVGTYRLEEQSDFALPGDDVDERFTGYHALGGVDVRVWRWFGAAGEARWATVPDALGSAGAAGELGESDLGGVSLRVRLLVGF